MPHNRHLDGFCIGGGTSNCIPSDKKHPPQSTKNRKINQLQALWMVLAAWLFATMGVCIKFASAHFTSLEVVFFRGLIGLVFMVGVMRWRKVSFVTPVPMMHLWRSIVGTTALTTWFYAISALPLATAMTLNYMSSVWLAAFLVGGALLMQQSGEALRRQGPLFLTVLIGFGGVALVLRPTIGDQQLFGGLMGLLSGMVSALAYLQVSALSKAVFFSWCDAHGLHRHAHCGKQQLAHVSTAVDAADWHLGRPRPVVHDPRLCQWCDLAGRQFAIHGHCVCGHLQRDDF
jgi:hypothetical protein